MSIEPGIPEVSVDVVRVFTDADGMFGNELGVVQTSVATRGSEQSIATQLGFSETVFVDEVTQPDESGARSAAIRIFTPAGELPFAGHPSVGTAWWLAGRATPVTVLEESAGSVLVAVEDDITWIRGEAAWAPEFEFTELATPDAVEALDPASYTNGHFYLWSWIDESAGRIRSRMFAPDMGIVEDEATGAAAVRITTNLGRDLQIEQGHGSRISTRLVAGGASDGGASVDVGGRTVYDRTVTI